VLPLAGDDKESTKMVLNAVKDMLHQGIDMTLTKGSSKDPKTMEDYLNAGHRIM